uniref:THAP9-like helix-turn-helix domain-containing protein n=1 Tax=Daphnia galeata TaxID=27404 RepID=A0A8J2RIY1_9CRUS|nr:unnamed protein product [Daphnia galeata]
MPKKSSVLCTLHFNKNDIKLTPRKISHRQENRLLDPVTLDDRLSQADSSSPNSSLKRLLFEETFLDVSSDSPTKRTPRRPAPRFTARNNSQHVTCRGPAFNCSKPAKGRRYTDSIRNLSVNLSFYSQAGYEKLRTIFTLPSLTSVKNHLAKVGCASGILKNALAEIQHKISEGHLAEATLSLDGMAIKKGIHWDSKLKK